MSDQYKTVVLELVNCVDKLYQKAVFELGQKDEEIKVLVATLEDFILESEHSPNCEYRQRFGLENECNCMDRNYYNKDACLIRAKEAIAKYQE